jgi:hypothetical protein
MPEASLNSPPLMPELLATALFRHDDRVAVAHRERYWAGRDRRVH